MAKTCRRVILLVGLIFSGVAAGPPAGSAAHVDLELWAPAREAARAIQAARAAKAAELAPQALRLADLYLADATAALHPPSGPSDVRRATRLFHLAEAQARLAEARAIELTRERRAADAAGLFLTAIEGSPPGMPPTHPMMPEAVIGYRSLQREAAQARAARRAAEDMLEERWRDGE